MLNKNDPVIIFTTHTHCDGGTQELGHPKVYLEVKPGTNKIICPYCSKIFICNPNPKSN